AYLDLPPPASCLVATDYLRSAQTQIVAGRTRYANPSTDPSQIAAKSSEILESILQAKSAENVQSLAENVPNLAKKPSKLTKRDSRSTFLERQNEWATILTSIFLSEGADIIQEEETAKERWLSVLAEMKGISKGTYEEIDWYLAFKESKLCGVFSTSGNYQQQKQDTVKYTKFDWKKQPVKIFQAMTWENVIPLQAFPSHVYTFLSQDNFIHVWNRSIAPGLDSDERHVDVGFTSKLT
ncbi:hypothetical protein F5877DRAFT_85783, partial [Lentinula edodes]